MCIRLHMITSSASVLSVTRIWAVSLAFVFASVGLSAAESVAELELQAKSGDAQAQYRLALLYWSGTDVPKNPKIAKVLLEKSAAGGWVDAKLLLSAVGSGFEAKPSRTPQIREQVGPTYPMKMRAANVQADVVVDFFVTAEGKVVGQKVVKITTYPSLKEESEMEAHLDFGASATEAVAKWTFDPGLKDGKPVATHMQVPVQFRLTEEKKR